MTIYIINYVDIFYQKIIVDIYCGYSFFIKKNVLIPFLQTLTLKIIRKRQFEKIIVVWINFFWSNKYVIYEGFLKKIYEVLTNRKNSSKKKLLERRHFWLNIEYSTPDFSSVKSLKESNQVN